MYQSNSVDNKYSQDESKFCFTQETQKTLQSPDSYITKQELLPKQEPLSPVNQKLNEKSDD